MKKALGFLLILLILIILGLLLPDNMIIPVKGASKNSWNQKTFWYYPWGRSIVHRGIDIFGKEGTPVISSTDGIVLYSGTISMGGNVVLVLGPQWRFHYYAHLRKMDVTMFKIVGRGEKIGEVGTTGNAAGTPPHLHYALVTLIPYPWRIDGSKWGMMKMFFLNPGDYFMGINKDSIGERG